MEEFKIESQSIVCAFIIGFIQIFTIMLPTNEYIWFDGPHRIKITNKGTMHQIIKQSNLKQSNFVGYSNSFTTGD